MSKGYMEVGWCDFTRKGDIMRLTSAEAAKYLRSLNGDYYHLLHKEGECYTFVASVQEDIEECRPEYDYKKVQKMLIDIEEEIRRVKHAINVFNSTTIVPGFDMTIDELLVYMPQLSSRLNKLDRMRNMEPRVRKNVDYGVIDYLYANYDIKEVEEDYKELSLLLSKAQLALDKLNSTVTFEI